MKSIRRTTPSITKLRSWTHKLQFMTPENCKPKQKAKLPSLTNMALFCWISHPMSKFGTLIEPTWTMISLSFIIKKSRKWSRMSFSQKRMKQLMKLFRQTLFRPEVTTNNIQNMLTRYIRTLVSVHKHMLTKCLHGQEIKLEKISWKDTIRNKSKDLW